MGLPNLFREPFAMQGFSFAASMCLKFTFASFRGKHVTEIRHFPQWSAYWNLQFQAQRTSFFSSYRCRNMWIDIASGGLLLLHLLVLHHTLNRELRISVGTAGPQQRAPDFSGHCRAPTATADLSGHSQTPQAPGLSGHYHSPIKWGGAIPASQGFRGSFAELSPSFHRFSGHIYRNL